MNHATDEAVRAVLIEAGTCMIANILLAQGLRGTMLRDVGPLAPDGGAMAGPAYTLRFIPSREDLDSLATYALADNKHRRAIEECPPGSVLVIDSNHSSAGSSMGDLMALRLRVRGVAGAVTDGGFRDSTGIIASGLPSFHRAPAGVATPVAFHAAGLQEPIGCAGVAVYPGDMIVGDSDGVVAIPRDRVAAVAEAAAVAVDYEVFAQREIRGGRSILEVFPATAESRLEFEKWAAAGRPGEE